MLWELKCCSSPNGKMVERHFSRLGCILIYGQRMSIQLSPAHLCVRLYFVNGGLSKNDQQMCVCAQKT